MKCSYCNELKDRNYGDFIFETKHWIIFLAPNQSNIGTCIVALKRCCGDLSGIKPEEWIDFGKIVEMLEAALKNAFNTTMFNWSSLMNSDYLKNPPNPHVHWHFMPRYRQMTEFEGLIFEDPYFGQSKHSPIREIPTNVREKIIEKIEEYLQL